MPTEHLSFCRICAAACGVVVTVDDGGAVTRVRGDDAHPWSRGYVCSKGRGLPAWHHSAARLDTPRLHGRHTSWDEALASLASDVNSVIDDRGRNAVAMYLATGFAYDAAGQVAAGLFMRGLGSSSFYSAATVDNAPVLVAAELVTGNMMLNPVWETDRPGLLMLVGTNPVVSHGYGTTLPDPVRRIRDYRAAGGRVWVLDPRRTETAALADEHLAVRPGTDVVVLAALAREVLADVADASTIDCTADDLDRLRASLARFTLDGAAIAAGIEVAALHQLLADLRAHRGRLAMFCGTGTTMAADGVLTEWLRWVLLALTASLDVPGGMRFNPGIVNRQRAGSRETVRPAPPPGPASRPDLGRVAGQMPSVALADEIEAGNIQALVVTGGNPVAAFPEPERVRRALASLPVLAVIDVVETELTEIATHVLPAAGQLERADITLAEHVAIRPGIQCTPAVVGRGENRRPSWWILATLAAELGLEIMPGLDVDSWTDETFLGALLHGAPVDAATAFAAGPRGVDIDVEYGWVRADMLPNGTWNIAPEALLARLDAHRQPVPDADTFVVVPRREMAWSNTIRYGPVHGDPHALPVVRLHGDDAADAGLADGDEAEIAGDHGWVRVRVAIDDNVRRRVLSMTHGRAMSPGRLTSARLGVDPMTAMPHASGIPVRLRPAPSA